MTSILSSTVSPAMSAISNLKSSDRSDRHTSKRLALEHPISRTPTASDIDDSSNISPILIDNAQASFTIEIIRGRGATSPIPSTSCSLLPSTTSRTAVSSSFTNGTRIKSELYRVFQFLDIHTMLTMVTRVCKTWNETSKDQRSWKVVQFWSIRGILTDDHLQKVVPLFKNVTHMDFFECYEFTDDGLALLARCPQLISLNLTSCHALTDRSTRLLAYSAPQLLSLDITCCRKITDTGLLQISSGCKKIQRLNLWGCAQITDEGIKNIAENCPQLVELNATWCKKLSDQTFRALNSCKNLKRLVLTWCEKVKDSGIQLLKLMPTLEYLDLDGCSYVSDSALRALGTRCPNLQVLKLRFLSRVSFSTLQKLVSQLTRLKVLDVSFSEIPKMMLQSLRVQFPNTTFVF